MTYQQTIAYLFKMLPMFSRMGSVAFKKDLTNTLALCEALDNPQTKFKSIHIGGTNGKGSVSHMLAAMLQTAGYKTGLYTSPHLYDFRERIKINGEMVSEDFVIRFVERVQPLIVQIQPSFFELTVAMAFDYFAGQGVDIAIIEVGLGGRLDSTNIITPELSIITNISKDHTNMLGHTMQAIAAEKAGIIKEGVPVVIGERNDETAPVFIEKASTERSPIFFAEDFYEVTEWQLAANYLRVKVVDKALKKSIPYQLDLGGIYQTRNIKTVLQAIHILQQKGWNINNNHIQAAFSSVKKLTGLQGRWEVVHQEPTIVLEVAHNEEGIRQMLQHLQHLSYNRLHILFGMVKDKEPELILSLLPKDAIYYFTQAQIPRALAATELLQKAQERGLSGVTYTDVNAALQKALSKAATDDLILVCGSIFLVAEVKRAEF
jgi:dihydrofolate synthase / folylpolyglutamate synthase